MRRSRGGQDGARSDRDVSVSTHSYRLFKYLSAYSVAIRPKVLSTTYVHACRSTSEITLSPLDKVLFNIFFVTLPYWPSDAIRAEIFTNKGELSLSFVIEYALLLELNQDIVFLFNF